MTNAIIPIDIRNLAKALPQIEARFASSSTVRLVNVPEDATGVYIRVFKADKESFFNCPANQDDNGDWECYIIGTCFPAACKTIYEVHAYDQNGNDTSLGRGVLDIEPFTVGGTPVVQGQSITVATLPDETGALHQVRAVNIGTPESPDWSWRVNAVDGTNG